MKAAVFQSFGDTIEITDVPDPSPSPDGVVLEIEANGICRSDWHAWIGHDPTVVLPHVPGHEMSGTIVAVGSDVGGFRIGDRVTVPFVLGCGACRECASGNQQICDYQYQPGFSGWGAFAEFVALPYAAGNLVELPEEMTFVSAAGLGCRFATAYRAVVDRGAVGEGTTVAVWGCGGVGLSAVMIASALGAEVVAVDIDRGALELASQFGAAHTVLSSGDPHNVGEVTGFFDGGAEVSFDALGSVETAVSSIQCLAKRGKHVQIGLMIGDAANPVIPMWPLHGKEIEMSGVHGMPAWQYRGMLKMIEDRRISPEALVTGTVDLQSGVEHLMAMGAYPGTGFVVIDEFSGAHDGT